MKRVVGKVRSDGHHADGSDHQFIAVKKRGGAGLPHREGGPVPVELEIGDRRFRAATRTTRGQKIVSITSVLRTPAGEKVRLVEALRWAGYGRNDEIVLEVDGTTVRVPHAPAAGDPAVTGTDGPPSDLLGGRYRLGKVIGRGGMGAVFAATDERLERPVAVKVISAAATTS